MLGVAAYSCSTTINVGVNIGVHIKKEKKEHGKINNHTLQSLQNNKDSLQFLKLQKDN